MADVQEKLAGQSATELLEPGEEFTAFIAAEKTKWGGVVKASGARIDCLIPYGPGRGR